jgi:triosephosphate isomerase
MRTPIIAGNWKMNKTIGEAQALVKELIPLVSDAAGVEVVVVPPYTAIAAVNALVGGTRIGLGAQDVFWKKSGAYTSQVSPDMLVDAGCKYAIIGHSETRGRFGVAEPDMTPELLHFLGETDESVNAKVKAAIAANLTPIMCCGETLSEREAGQADAIVSSQVEKGLDGLSELQVSNLVIAYEPVWAIGTGKTCDANEADRICGVIRSTVAKKFGQKAADAVRIQYGGSMKPSNAAELLAKPNIDGGLIGGAALKAADFAGIITAAKK